MTLKIYNTLKRKKESFKPINKNKVKIYTCGPTVYAPPHIGNYRSFVVSDLIKRYLEYLGYSIYHVMNITDIDDKTIRASGNEGLSLKKFTDKYTKIFFDEIKKLNMKPADVYPKATDYINDMIKMTKTLIEKGYAYVKSGSVYFNISKFKNYGKLSKINLNEIKIGKTVDIDEYDKDNPRDFALMKASTEKEVERGIYFESEWGKVRPGWHIECSTLSTKFLGDSIDIHTGGVDLIFPHHENEIAQSEAYYNKKVIKYWVHSEHLIINGRKMSKSLGNYLTLEDLLEKYNPNIIRYMFLSTHYRKKINFTNDKIKNAKKNYERLKETYERTRFFIEKNHENKNNYDQEFIKVLNDIKNEFSEAMNDDFNTPLALRKIHNLAREINIYLTRNKNKIILEEALKLFENLSEVFGLTFNNTNFELTPSIKKLLEERGEARKSKNWSKADKIRMELENLGIVLLDTPEGVRLKIKNKEVLNG